MARARVGDPLPDEDGAGQLTPLVHLATLPHMEDSGLAVLSVGGNDLREVRWLLRARLLLLQHRAPHTPVIDW